MISDIIDWLHDNNWEDVIRNGHFTEDDFDNVFNILWTEDSVTGNGSGSYWVSTWKAEEALCHNWELFQEAYETWGYRKPTSAEDADVLIRCYLLGRCLDKAVERIEFQDAAKRELEIPF